MGPAAESKQGLRQLRLLRVGRNRVIIELHMDAMIEVCLEGKQRRAPNFDPLKSK